MRWARDERERSVACGFGGRELVLGDLELVLHGSERLELLRRRLASELHPAAQVVDPRDERTPALVGLEQRVELLGGAFPRERLTPGVGVAASGLQIDHELKSRKAWALLAGDRGDVRRDVRALLVGEARAE